MKQASAIINLLLRFGFRRNKNLLLSIPPGHFWKKSTVCSKLSKKMTQIEDVYSI
jgi:hypothetical protein